MAPKLGKATLVCSRVGCKGTCPLHVVVRSNKADGVPAKCFTCERKYVVPKDFIAGGGAKGSGKGRRK